MKLSDNTKHKEMLIDKVLMKWYYTIIARRARAWETIQLKLNKVSYICKRESHKPVSIVEETSQWMEETLSSYLYHKKIKILNKGKPEERESLNNWITQIKHCY